MHYALSYKRKTFIVKKKKKYYKLSIKQIKTTNFHTFFNIATI